MGNLGTLATREHGFAEADRGEREGLLEQERDYVGRLDSLGWFKRIFGFHISRKLEKLRNSEDYYKYITRYNYHHKKNGS